MIWCSSILQNRMGDDGLESIESLMLHSVMVDNILRTKFEM
jgi:hypothetical protein